MVTNLSQPQRAGAVPGLIRHQHHWSFQEAILCINLHCTPKTPVATLRLSTKFDVQIHGRGWRFLMGQP